MSFHELPESEQLKIAAEVDYFVSVLLRRYGMSEGDIPEVVASLRWLREHREFIGRVQSGGTLSMISLLIAALGATVWQGIRSLIGAGK